MFSLKQKKNLILYMIQNKVRDLVILIKLKLYYNNNNKASNLIIDKIKKKVHFILKLVLFFSF